MPQGHLVALCTDLGIAPSHGAAMLSVLLTCAFFSRLFWGRVADRIGGLRTVLAGSVCQIAAMVGFLLTHSEAGLFAVATFFGLGFSGMILTCWLCANCSRRPKQRGGCRPCCCSAGPGWPPAAGRRRFAFFRLSS